MALGAAAVASLREPLRPFGTVVRPLAKSALKAGLIIGEQGRQRAAEIGELFEDLAAEAQAERSDELLRRPRSVSSMPSEREPDGH